MRSLGTTFFGWRQQGDRRIFREALGKCACPLVGFVMTSPPDFKMGVATLCLAVSCMECSTRSTSSKLPPQRLPHFRYTGVFPFRTQEFCLTCLIYFEAEINSYASSCERCCWWLQIGRASCRER